MPSVWSINLSQGSANKTFCQIARLVNSMLWERIMDFLCSFLPKVGFLCDQITSNHLIYILLEWTNLFRTIGNPQNPPKNAEWMAFIYRLKYSFKHPSLHCSNHKIRYLCHKILWIALLIFVHTSIKKQCKYTHTYNSNKPDWI